MKKRFRFRLAVVERVRAEKEQQLLRLLAQAQKKIIEAQNFRNGIMTELDASLLRRERLGEVVQDILAYQMESQFILGQKLRMQHADQHILRSKKQLEKVLREYLEAKRALRAIELLREKAYFEYKLEQKKKEQKETEELYVLRAARSTYLRNEEEESA